MTLSFLAASMAALAPSTTAAPAPATEALPIVRQEDGETPPVDGIPEDTEIVTLPSGLKYSVLQAGDGKAFPKRGDRIKVHYTGWLESTGKEFDSSRRRGEPTVFSVGALIDGWNEGLKLMSPGARFKMTIPSDLGYGDQGNRAIPGGATLIFDVELIEIVQRAPEFVPWTDQLTKTELEKGIQMHTIAAGEGKVATECAFVMIEYNIWDAKGKLLTGSALSGRPLQGNPAQFQLDVFKEAMPSLRQGSDVLLRVPAETAKGVLSRMRVEVEGDTYWRFSAPMVVEAFEKPPFEMPADGELTTTPSGLKYKILRKGTGAFPSGPNATVTCHYSGWLTDGTPFDNSYDRGEPSSFGLRQVVGGWTEGIPLVDVGGKILLVIPSDLGYGDGGRPPTIPGGATLVFVVELLATNG